MIHDFNHEILGTDKKPCIPAADDNQDSNRSWFARYLAEANRVLLHREGFAAMRYPSWLMENPSINKETVAFRDYYTPIGWDDGQPNGKALGEIMIQNTKVCTRSFSSFRMKYT